MPQIAHAFSEQATRQTVTGTTYTTVLSHASSNFVAGQKYLIMVTALCDGPNGTDDILMRTIHGATAFADSEYILEPVVATLKPFNYAWFTVWTAVSSEAIDFQIACADVAQTVGADLITIFSMRLDADLVENTDWFFNEVTTDVALTTSPVTGASVTFTPLVSTNWLVLSSAQHDVTGTTSNYASQILPTGTYTDAAPKVSREGENAANILLLTIARVFTDFGGVSQTMAEQSWNDAGAATGTRLNSKIFALNLNKFRQRVLSFDPDPVELGNTQWEDDLGAGALIPVVAGDLWILANGIFVPGVSSNEIEHRLQVDDVDQPAGQTTDAYDEEEPQNGTTDRGSVWRQTVETVTAGVAHWANWDGRATIDNAAGCTERTFIVVTMELAGNVPQIVDIPYEALGFVNFSADPYYETCKDPFSDVNPSEGEFLPVPVGDGCTEPIP